jgi:hypothetical protein
MESHTLRPSLVLYGIVGLGLILGIGCVRLADPKIADNADETSSAPGKAIKMPSEKAVDELIHSTLADLTRAVESDDFSELYSNASTDFQSTYTLEQVKDNFKVYQEQSTQVAPILKGSAALEPDFSAAPLIRTEKGLQILVANGTFDTSPQKLRFETEYVNRAGEWRMLGLVVNIK